MSTATSTIQWVEDAVRHHPLHTRAGFWQGVFAHWFSSFVYNQIWEDPRVDAEALQLGPESRVLTISSGGCNVLHYLLSDPAAVTAIDLNSTHLALLRLKLAALRGLPSHAEFYRMFGEAQSDGNLAAYERWVREKLDESSREYWEEGGPLRLAFAGRRLNYLREGLYNFSHLGFLLRLVHWVGWIHGRDLSRILRARSLEEQRRIYAQELAPLLEGRLFRTLTKLPFALFSLGIPPQQGAALRAEAQGDLAAVLRARVERLACHLPMADNYFAWQAFSRRYDHAQRLAIPDYLAAENFEALRERVTRVETQQCGLREFLGRQAPGAFNAFVLLDAQDWMPDREIAALWAEIARVSPPRGRIIFRTAAAASPIERALPAELLQRFARHDEASAALHARDRSAIYGGFHLYEVRP